MAPPSGKFANVEWRAVPMDVVRAHPRFKGLPSATRVIAGAAAGPTPNLLAEAALFRQEDWRWDAVHAGRLTGSRIAAALGFFEADAAQALRIPRSLASHARAVAAARHLAAGVALDDAQLARLFVVDGKEKKNDDDRDEPRRIAWTARSGTTTTTTTFALDDNNPVGVQQRRSSTISCPLQARLAWGHAQEGVGVVAAVDYAEKHCPKGTFVAEAGMLAAEAPCLASLATFWAADKDKDNAPGGLVSAARALDDETEVLKFGASPDGLLVHDDGTVDIVEIKSVSPFKRLNTGETMTISDPGPHDRVGAWHVPQLMLEMYCAGPRCTGALIISVSATRGAIFKHVPRDDAYIADMLRLTRRFHDRFCDPVFEAPPACFNADEPSFDHFLSRTRDIAAAAQIRAVFPDVQRAPPKAESFFFPAR